MHLHEHTSPEIAALDTASKVFILPLGSIEQHGPHLPLSTDTALVGAVADGVHERLGDSVIMLPVLWCGHSTHHLAFPGTISVSQGIYQALIGELCDSMIKSGARKILLLNGHGGNDIPVRYAMRDIKSRHADVEGLQVVFASYWSLAADELRAVRESGPGGMGHACEMETSVMLLKYGELVKMNLARNDGPAQRPPYRITDMQHGTPYYMVEEFHEISESGTVGHPELASLEKGQLFFDGTINAVCAFIEDFKTW
jgi:creatinine amidohydrolase